MQRILLILLLLTWSQFSFAQNSSNEALANDFLKNGDFEKAAKLYEQLYNSSGSETSYNNLLFCQLKLKQFDKAEKLAQHQIKKSSKSLSYMVDLGNIYRQSGNNNKAKEQFNSVLNNLPAEMFAISEISNKFYSIAEYDYAIQAFKKGRQLIGNETMFTFELTRLYTIKQDKITLIEELLNQVKINPAFITSTKTLLAGTLEDKKDFEMFRTILQKRLNKDSENMELAELQVWLFLQQKDYNSSLSQAISYDKKFDEDGQRVLSVGQACINNDEYDIAIKAFSYLVSKGNKSPLYQQGRIELLTARNKKITAGNFKQKDLLELEEDYKSLLQEFGTSSETVFAIRELANLQAYQLNKPNDAIALLEEAIKLPRLSFSVQAQCKLDLGDLYILTGDVWEATLIYGQVDKALRDNPLGQEARFRNAQLSYFNGDFDWAKAQLDVLKASTSQLFANDALNLSLVINDNLGPDSTNAPLKMYAKAELLIFQNKTDNALAKLDSIDILYPNNSLNDDILMAKAKIYIKKGQTEKAVNPLTEICEKYSYDVWADDALFMLADLYENKLHQPAKAQTLYEQLITKFPGSLYVIEARKHFRILRGDVVN
ncbi:tetratricopeptide repeat protein [Solitalea koreensis]|uniref:Tetratricopeptide repeat-containing protein n=1 Tax=Solitalea koreensis TaxID=543615 RepID=A0A521AUW1_9SPHI|nr:tetratricopeptide repeat protein [Solitalea koreensis]SMO38642.1 Tetratricopeptide repeat-containing protein [Solitalea koreensis]